MSARALLLAKGADESAASREAALESAISAGAAARKRPRAAPERSALATWIDDGEALVAGLAADGAITDVDLRDFRRSMERVRSLTTGWRSRSRKVWGDAGVSTACLEFCSPECLAALRGASSAFRAMAMRECLWRLHADRQPICVALKQGLWLCFPNSPYREYVRVARHLVSPRFRDQKFLCTPPRRDAEFVLVYAVALAGGGAPVTGVCDVSTSPSGRLFAMWRRGRHPELDDRPTAAFDGARASVSLLRKAPERKILCLGHGLVADGAGADDSDGPGARNFVRFRAGGGDSRALRVTSFLIKRKLRYEMSDSEDDEYVGEQPTSADVDVELVFHARDGPPRDTHGATHGFVVRLLDNNGYSVRQNLGILDGLGDNAWV